jgi:hypothetical protein
MTVLFREVSFACLLMATHKIAAAFERAKTKSRCLKVSPSESIVAAIQTAHAQGNFKNCFVLKAELAGTETVLDKKVHKAELTVTSKTTTSIGNG